MLACYLGDFILVLYRQIFFRNIRFEVNIHFFCHMWLEGRCLPMGFIHIHSLNLNKPGASLVWVQLVHLMVDLHPWLSLKWTNQIWKAYFDLFSFALTDGIPKDTPASHNGRAERPIYNPKGQCRHQNPVQDWAIVKKSEHLLSEINVSKKNRLYYKNSSNDKAFYISFNIESIVEWLLIKLKHNRFGL